MEDFYRSAQHLELHIYQGQEGALMCHTGQYTSSLNQILLFSNFHRISFKKYYLDIFILHQCC